MNVSAPAFATPPARRDAANVRHPSWPARLLDAWVILLLVNPIYGCFYPLESYLSLGQGEGMTGYAGLPIPVTTLTLIATSLSAIWFTVQVSRLQRFQHSPLAYVYVLCAFISAAWAYDPIATVQRALRLLPAIGLGLTLPQLYQPKKILRLMTIAFFIGAMISIFMAVSIPAYGLSRLGNGYEFAWRGATIHKNFSGLTFGIGVVVSFSAWRARALPWQFSIITLLLCLVVLVKSNSGTGISAATITLLGSAAMLMVVRSPKEARLLLSLVIMLVAASVVVLLIVAPKSDLGDYRARYDLYWPSRYLVGCLVNDLVEPD